MSDHWHLRNVDWLQTLPKATAAALRRAATEKTYALGETIFGPTRHPEEVCLLEEGLVRIFRRSPRGGELTIGYVRPGEVFGEVSVIGDRPRVSFAKATKPSKVLRIPRETFFEVTRSSNAFLFQITKTMGQRLVRCQARAADLVFLTVPSRLARMLLRLATEFGRKTRQGHIVGLPFTQHELATLIGATRQTVSEVLREMITRGLLRRVGHDLVLNDLDALRELGGLPPSETVGD